MGLVALIGLQALAALFFVADVTADLAAGEGADPHALVELAAVALLVAGVGLMGAELRRVLSDQARMDDQIALAAGAFQQMLDRRFEDWRLTPAEREVALFALKGLNIARIAELRGAREGTVKAQLSSVYAKAGAAGKHELLAGFVEDFLDRAESGSARSGPDGDVRR
ncbi:helix-turn-helix transcriptional regulator [Albimonas sp. CAU 1670]|uniref:helix-turn-helix transcriptional regulator n=1 Tax=Albimonas sp. CAU 1670 TaxID=3032599 RepID=UPI0023DA60A0|nr:helix-turn-helix transcriptional regulator [Albimonas sp. CAU 1670]MDF2232236.1 helix-turn-helix transcriptional regulator [Albimonas sp. CAU 1670]